MRIIAAALMLGVLVFAVVAAVVRQPVPGDAVHLIGTIAVILAVAQAVAAAIVFRAVTATALRRHASTPPDPDADLAATAAAYQTAMIVALALLEAPAFLGLIAFLLGGDLWVLAAPALSLGSMPLYFPSEAAVRELADRLPGLRDEVRGAGPTN
jgi:hypothetical protein